MIVVLTEVYYSVQKTSELHSTQSGLTGHKLEDRFLTYRHFTIILDFILPGNVYCRGRLDSLRVGNGIWRPSPLGHPYECSPGG